MAALARADGRLTAKPLLRVAVAGPESSGKTTLSTSLAEHFRTVFVPEASRAYYDSKGVVYEIGDILPIARAQSASEQEMAPRARGFLVLDTDLLTVAVWSHVLYGGCPAEAEAMAAAQRVDLTLLLRPDLPWTYDPQRCHPELSQREDFFERLRDGLTRLGRPFTIVGGDGPERFAAARSAVDALLAGR